MENISLILYSAGAIGFALAAIAFRQNRQKIFDPVVSIIAAIGLAIWQFVLAWNSVKSLPSLWLIGVELLRASVVLLYVHRTMRAATGQGMTWPALATTVTLGLLIPGIIGFAHPEFIRVDSVDYQTLQRAWAGVFISVGLLIALEQVFRNALGASNPMLRIASIALAVTVIFDLYMFANTLIFEQLDLAQWRARGGVNAIAAFATALMVTYGRQARVLSVSREVVFYTASLTVAGLFLLVISIAGYTFRQFGGSWGSVFELILFFSAILFVAVAALSQRVRDRIRVYVVKNFFALKYDYRNEWLRLIHELTGKGSQDELYVRAIRVLADLYKCAGGILWLQVDKNFIPTAPCRMKLPEGSREPVDSSFCNRLRQEWIFEMDDHSIPDLPHLPGWVAKIPELGIILPLLLDDELIGFIGLQRSLGLAQMTWEDLEILKTASRQVASYIARHQAGEQLSRARQFDTYHQLTAFIMHDLKNLIAQQELVVKNAARHKENPAFVEDAIDTIQNSVTRMSALLGKLQQREPVDKRPIDLEGILFDAVKKCSSLKPVPALRINARGLRVTTDRDHIVMVVSHIIKNAQEATTASGFVDVTLRSTDGVAVIEVEDNGSGMDADFIRTRLFKPFESTKAGKGMGIGTYQAREFIRGLGGDVQVQSKPEEGTTFTLRLPLAPDPVLTSKEGALRS